MPRVWRFFTLEEMQCRCCGKCEMDYEFMAMLDDLRQECGFPFPINSGYRCSKHNNSVSHTGFDGPHTFGKAADIRVYGTRALELIEAVMHPEIKLGGIGLKQHGSHESRFIHIDTLGIEYHGPRPWIWTY